MKQASYTEYKWFWLSQSHDSQASIEIIPSPLNLKHAFEKPANVWLNQNHWICEKRYFSWNNYTKKSDLIWSYALHLSVSYFPFIWWSAAPVMAISRCLRDRSFREQIFGKYLLHPVSHRVSEISWFYLTLHDYSDSAHFTYLRTGRICFWNLSWLGKRYAV